MDDLFQEYENLRSEYKKIIVDAFNPDDFAEYTENLFTAHSCAIEGNSFSVNETRDLKEKGLDLKIYDKSLFEAFEILDHFKAYEFAMKNLSRPLTEDFLKELHFILTEHTINYRNQSNPGEYTQTDMGAGDTIFGDHKENVKRVPKLLEQTQNVLDKNLEHPLSVSAKFHKFFIYLHPFRDGNGRLGRLLSNFILAKSGHPLVIINQEKKNNYIEALKASEKHRDSTPIVNFFIETSMQRMRSEIAQKKNLTENFFLRIKEDPEEEQERPRGFRR
ncbi:Fic family protein [Epilithonimonas caeni]|uniref:Fic family protein n=1 Tax=Epilithonimonas caeni TaxID=365343 RepID=UPI0004280EE2|nr:Fic family protein [Epilithonimonas caeni]